MVNGTFTIPVEPDNLHHEPVAHSRIRLPLRSSDVTKRPADNPMTALIEPEGSDAQSMLAILPAVAVVLTPDGSVDYINPFLEELSGFRLADVRGRSWFETFIPERDRKRLAGVLGNVLEDTGLSHGIVNAIITADGGERLIEWSNTMMLEAGTCDGRLLAIGVDVTAREEAQATSDAENRRLRNILDSMASYVGLFDLEGRLVEANRAPLDDAGIARTDVIGRPFWETAWWSHSAETAQRVRAALASAAQGETVRGEFEACLGESGCVLLDIVFAPQRDEKDRIVGVVASGIDVSEQVRSREEMRKRKARFRSLVENARDTFFRLSVPSGRFSYISPSAERNLGYPADDFLADTGLIERIIHPESRDYFDRQWANIRNGQVDAHFSYRIVDPLGAPRWIEQSNSPVFDGDGRIVAMEGIMRDVTEQHIAAETLRHSEQRFRDFAELSSDWLCEFDRDMRLSLLVSGRQRGEEPVEPDLLGKPLADMIPGDLRAEEQDEWNAILSEIRAGRSYRDLPATILTAAGERRRILGSGTPLFASDGRFTGYRGTAVDITELVATQQAEAESEQRFRSLVESGTIGVVVYDHEHRPLYASPLTVEMFGFGSTREFLEISSLDEVLDQTEIERIKDLRRNRVSGGDNPPVIEVLCRKKDGSPIWMLSRAASIEWDGRPAIMSTWIDITAQKLTEDALARSETRLVQAQRIAQVGSWEFHHDSRRWRWSDEYQRLFRGDNETGPDSPETFADSVHPDDRAETLQAFDRAAREGLNFSLTHRIIRADGVTCWIHSQGETVFDGDGKPVVTRGTCQDVTEAKLTALALEKTAKRLEEAQRIGRLGSWELDIPSGRLEWSLENYRIREVEPGTKPPTYAAFLQTLHPDDRERVRHAYEDSVRERRPYTATHRLIMPDGRVKWVQQRAETIYGDDGEPLTSRGTVHDITEQHETEQALQELADRLNEAQRIAHLGSWTLDLKTQELSWSDETYRIFEVDPDGFEANYDTFLAFVDPEDREAVNQAYLNSVENRTPYNIIHRVRLLDGKVKWVEERGETLYDADGEPVLSRGTIQDITEVHQAQTELRSSLQEKEVLLREIHHRVKNNLQIISSLLYFQSRNLDDEKGIAGLQDIRNRLNAMVLVHERLYRSPDLAHIGLSDYAATLARELERLYRDRNPRVELSVGGAPFLLPAETALPLGMILTELVSNAYKYAFPDGRGGGIRIEFGQDGDRNSMTIADDGVGLPADFDPEHGESFGWRVVRALVEQIDGSLETVSDGGVRATVTFPVPEEAAA